MYLNLGFFFHLFTYFTKMTLLNIYSTDINLNTNCKYDNIIPYFIYYILVLDYVFECITSRGLGY